MRFCLPSRYYDMLDCSRACVKYDRPVRGLGTKYRLEIPSQSQTGIHHNLLIPPLQENASGLLRKGFLSVEISPSYSPPSSCLILSIENTSNANNSTGFCQNCQVGRCSSCQLANTDIQRSARYIWLFCQ